MDPLQQLRGDIDELRGLHPLDRARARAEVAEAAEIRKDELARQARREQVQNDLARLEMVERAEVATQGYTSRELARQRAEDAALKQEKITLLEEQLERLDPQRAAVKRAQTRRAAQDMEDARVLARAREISCDPFMRAEVARFDQRQAARDISRSAPPRWAPSREYDPPAVMCDGCGHLSCHCYTWRGGQQYEERRPGPCQPEEVRARCTGCQSNGHARRSVGTGWPEPAFA